jgi:sucrose-6-phosphate hydrolase SacC (GH32 family)
VLVTYTTASRTLTLDTADARYGQAGTWNATIDTSPDGALTMDILIDRSSLEIFTVDGTAMTATVYPRYEESNAIEIVAAWWQSGL